MSNFWKNIQPAIKKETRRVAFITLIGVFVMWFVFLVLHITIPEKVAFDYTVIVGGIGGGFITVLNFFLMGLMVQDVTLTTEQDVARSKVRVSYSQRLIIQMIWGIIVVAAPGVHYVAGLLPLLFPSIGIKLTGILLKNNQGAEVDENESGHIRS